MSSINILFYVDIKGKHIAKKNDREVLKRMVLCLFVIDRTSEVLDHCHFFITIRPLLLKSGAM